MEPLLQTHGQSIDISMDLIVGLLMSRWWPQGRPYNAILVVVDRYTKIAQYFKGRNTIDTADLTKIIVQSLAL